MARSVRRVGASPAAREVVPAPWQLRGEGLALLYRLRAEGLDSEPGREGNAGKEAFCGGIGAVILVDYAASPVGPYRELLFIPGRYRYAVSGSAPHPRNALEGKERRITAHTISSIYVTTQESRDGGRLNWGIPKGLARIDWKRDGAWSEVTVNTLPDASPALSARFRGWGVALPFGLRFLPHTLAQANDSLLYVTKVSGRGSARLARITDLAVNERLFPALADCRPFAAVSIPFATLLFPKAATYTWR